MKTQRRTAQVLMAAVAVAALAAGCGNSSAVSSGRSVDVTTLADGAGASSVAPATEPEAGEPAGASAAGAEAEAALDAARQRWARAALADYSLVVEEDCSECGPDEPSSGRVVAWGGTVYASGAVVTVDNLFARIERAIADGREVVATYDDETGYPSEVLIDASQAPVGGGTRLAIDEFRPGLPGEEFSPPSFEEAARRWQANRPHSYEYVVTIACGGCPYEGRLYVKVVGDAVVEDRFDSAGDESAGGVTIDRIFEDLGELFGSDRGLIEDGVLINGSAEYDPEYGYPNWIGLDLEIVEPQEWSRNLPSRLVYMIGRFDPLEADGYCAAVDELFSMNPADRPDTRYQRQLQRITDLAPAEHRRMWELLSTLVGEPFDYENLNPAADALDATADRLTATCPTLGFFAMNDDGYVTYLQ